MLVWESSGGKTVLYFEAWNFRNCKGPYSANKDLQKGDLESEGRKTKAKEVAVVVKRTLKIWTDSATDKHSGPVVTFTERKTAS